MGQRLKRGLKPVVGEGGRLDGGTGGRSLARSDGVLLRELGSALRISIAPQKGVYSLKPRGLLKGHLSLQDETSAAIQQAVVQQANDLWELDNCDTFAA